MNKQEVIEKLEANIKQALKLYDQMSEQQKKMREAIVMMYDVLEEIK